MKRIKRILSRRDFMKTSAFMSAAAGPMVEANPD